MNRSDYNRFARSLFVPSQPRTPKFKKLTLERYHMNVSILNGAATTEVEIVLHNPNDSAIGGFFVFLLPPVMDLSDTRPVDTEISQIELRMDGTLTQPRLLAYHQLETLYQRVLPSEDSQTLLRMLGNSGVRAEVPQIPAHREYRIQIRYPDLVEWIDESFFYQESIEIDQPIGRFSVSMDLEDRERIGEVRSNFPDENVTRESDTRVRITYQTTNVHRFKASLDCCYTLGDGVFWDSEDILHENTRLFEPVASAPDLLQNVAAPVLQAPMPSHVFRDVEVPAPRKSMPSDTSTSKPPPLSFSRPTGLTPPNGAAYHDVYFQGHGTNPFIDPEDDNLSTFGMDADSASYSVTRRYLQDGNLPPIEAVRVEEFVNAFDYDYTPPRESAFAVYLEGAPLQFSKRERAKLLRVGIQGRVVSDIDRKDAVLTFVIDVSGSMGSENRLGLVKKALQLLVNQLRPADKIGIVVYGTDARVVLPHTSVVNREHILEQIEALCPEGVTNVEDGIRTGYKLALQNIEEAAINRVILCSDGVANEGVTHPKTLLKQIQDYVEQDIFLTTVGFGMGNYNDTLMEELAKKGNGNYAYVDTLNEAHRIFVGNLTGTLQVIAKDAKVQVAFNPDLIHSFRLIGYENRQMKHEDFRNDDADAGEIGSGHSVTALYEVKLNKGVDSGQLAKVSIRYEDPDTGAVTEVGEAFRVEDLKGKFENTSPGLQFAATVAQFAEILRESHWAKDGCLKSVQQTLEGILQQHPEVVASGREQAKTRGEELLALVRNARGLKDQAER